MDEAEDPGANTAMFRAFVEHGEPRGSTPTASRTPWIAAGAVVVAVVIVVIAAVVALG